MRSTWQSILALALGLFATAARAEEQPWRPAGQSNQLIAQAGSTGAAVTLGPPVSLGQPIPLAAAGTDALGGAPLADSGLRTTSFFQGAAPVFRAAAPADASIARPMPQGPSDGSASMTSWSRAPDPNQPAEQAPAPKSVPDSAGPAMSGPGPVTNGQAPVTSGSSPVWGCLSNPCNPCPDVCSMPSCCWPGACCGGCDHTTRWYIDTDYLLWWFKNSPTPVLVTTGNASAAVNPVTSLPDPRFAGALGQSGTIPLFGGDINTGVHSGGRLNFGYWFTDDHCIGLDFGGFFLGSHADNFSASSRGDTILARPFFDTIEQNAEAIANLSQGVAGSVSVSQRSSLWGGEANVRSNVWCGCCMNLDALAGFRAIGLDENLDINESLVVLGSSPSTAALGGSRIDVFDQFKTSNRFFGGQIGAVAEFRKGPWILDLTSKVAIGESQEMVEISGATTVTPVVSGVTGTTASGPGGLLTGATTNIGNYTRDRFAVVPELGINLGYQCTEHIRLVAGYNFLYWSNVARPGQEINTTVNPLRVFGSTTPTGVAQPSFAFKDTDFWAQGVNFGIQFRY